MLSDFRKKKLSVAFDIYDADNNELIERTDIELFAHSYANILGLTPGSEQYQTLIEHELSVWEKLSKNCDLNRDGKISRDEFFLGFEKWQENIGDLIVFLVRSYESTFKYIDRDEDGKISFDEFVAFTNTDRQNREACKEIFGRLDTDQDGDLSFEELQKHYFDYFLSEDPSAPGTEFWGKLPS